MTELEVHIFGSETRQGKHEKNHLYNFFLTLEPKLDWIVNFFH